MAPLATAACVAVGSELLGERRLDSNSLRITATLARYGIRVLEKRVVGDDEARLAETIRELLGMADVVVLTGGLGPTADDVTREAIARALGRTLEVDAEVAAWLADRFAAHGRVMPDVARRMARVVAGSRVLRNQRGAAPGVLVRLDGRLLVAFPGVSWEMEEMLERELEPVLAAANPDTRLVTRTLVLGGALESDVEARVAPLYERFGRERVTILARCGVVRLVLTAEGAADEERTALDEMTESFSSLVAEELAGIDVSGVEEVVVDELRRRGQTLAVAESCTGGLLGATITSVPGASDVFEGGVVSYSNAAKERLLAVPSSLLQAHGAVSEPVAEAMAAGVRERFSADWGVAITGVAGPGGGTPDKPVGLVHWAVASPGAASARHRVFPGGREVVREWSVNMALDLLRRKLREGG